MRDLANQNFSSSNSSKRGVRSSALGIVVILIIILGLAFFAKSKLFGSGNTVGSSSVELREAPRGLVPVNVKSQNTGGVDLKTETAKFTLVKKGFSGKAAASRSYADGNFILSIDATLEDPKGYKYGVWAVNGNDVLLVDYMAGTGNSYNLRVNRNDDKFMKYKGLWITLERSELDGAEEHIFEGTF